jgi:hypothetical protein
MTGSEDVSVFCLACGGDHPMSERCPDEVQWWASPACTAPMIAHLLDDPPERDRTVTLAKCGDRRRLWQRLEEFARPDAFELCGGCLLVAGVET